MLSEATVYVVDDDEPVRAARSRLIAAQGIRVQSFASAEAFLTAFHPQGPACLILDVRLGSSNGLDLQDALVTRGAAIPIVVITAYGTVPATVRAMRAGALDVLEKPFNPRQLLERVRQALERDHAARSQHAVRVEASKQIERLTPREQEVLGLSVAGKTAKEIGATLRLSARTVEVHRAHILEKTGAPSMADLVKRFVPPGGD